MNAALIKHSDPFLAPDPSGARVGAPANDNWRPLAANDNNLATSVTHMPFGPVASLTWGNGVTDARTFDLDYRMTSITDHGTANIQYLSYSYNAGNNPTTITDNVTGGNTQTLTYDQIDRLKSATGAYGTVSSITYDSNSNRKTYGAISYATPGLNDRMITANGSSITYISTGNVNDSAHER